MPSQQNIGLCENSSTDFIGGYSDLTPWAGRGLQPHPQRFLETAAQRKRSGTGCKPVPAQRLSENVQE
jgi:hypothetical protein